MGIALVIDCRIVLFDTGWLVDALGVRDEIDVELLWLIELLGVRLETDEWLMDELGVRLETDECEIDGVLADTDVWGTLATWVVEVDTWGVDTCGELETCGVETWGVDTCGVETCEVDTWDVDTCEPNACTGVADTPANNVMTPIVPNIFVNLEYFLTIYKIFLTFVYQ